ncbi:MAG TPA: acyl-CoA thioesterase/BAAT N-terminal domain-containing protein [Candidatus Binataceae bacterium]|nr:acyl-CoA thioesterase/BAAT N-terminal domain-containing protein [Candidatus Binataceae bacterium]
MNLQVSLLDSTVDQSLEIRASGLAPEERVTLRLSLLKPHLPWQSEAKFVANDAGMIDLAHDAPARGSYEDADPMGLIWSMRLPLPIHEKLLKGEIAPDPRWGVERD